MRRGNSSPHGSQTGSRFPTVNSGRRPRSGQSSLSESEFADPRNEPNPFILPKEDVFMMRERERREKLIEKERQNSLPIWEKTSNRYQSFHNAARMRNITRIGSIHKPMQDSSFQTHPRRKKENMAEFISKKREMFLTQMSLNTKKQEKRKLEEKAEMKENALKKSETMLEEDALRFGKFLKINDSKAHEALQNHEKKEKEKKKKQAEIKEIDAEIHKYQTDISQQEDILLRCNKYKDFLFLLAPKQFHVDRKARKAARKARRDAEYVQKGLAPKSDDESSSDDDDEELPDGWSQHRTDDGKLYYYNAKKESKTYDRPKRMPFETEEDLTAVLTQLEQRSLFLIENSQEDEQALDLLKRNFDDKKEEMNAKTAELEENLHKLRLQISEEEKKTAEIRQRLETNTIEGDQLDLLNGLKQKVFEVAATCGFDDASLDPLYKLRQLEGWLEYLLDQLTEMVKTDEARVSDIVNKRKKASKQERSVKKKQRDKEAQLEQEAKSNARANAQIIRRTGRQVMFRSMLPDKRQLLVVEEPKVNKQEVELKGFFT